jgi:hypothetical protein
MQDFIRLQSRLNACEADEIFSIYLAEFIGDDHLMIGSDYGYNDPAEEKALGPDNEIARRSFGRIG